MRITELDPLNATPGANGRPQLRVRDGFIAARTTRDGDRDRGDECRSTRQRQQIAAIDFRLQFPSPGCDAGPRIRGGIGPSP